MLRLISATLALIIVGAGCTTTVPGPSADHASCPRCRVAEASHAATQPTDRSLYLMSAKWETDDGRSIQLSDLAGHPQIISMFFATCEGSCLLTLEHLQEVEASLPAEIRVRTGFVLVTFDSANDTPKILAAYRSEHHLASSRWTLLRGTPQGTAQLASLLGIEYSIGFNRRIVHSNAIVTLDEKGNVIDAQTGNQPDLAKPLAAVQTASISGR